MKKLIYLVLCLCFCNAYSQNARLNKAHQKYNDLAYIDATEIYLKVAVSGYESKELLQRIGNAYYFKANYTEAEKWYSKLYNLSNGILDYQYLLRYSQTLKTTGKIEEAERVYNAFIKASGVLNEEFKSSQDYLNIIEENSNRYTITPLPINYEATDFGAFYKDNTLYFSSTRSLKKRKIIDAWNNEPFLDIYAVTYHEKEQVFGVPTALKGEVNTKFHESSPIITKDGKTLYFTRSNTTPKIKKSKKEPVQLKIYRATKEGDKWVNIEDLSINGDNFSNVNPVLSPDEKTLFFASNMPTSLGQTDIFSVSIQENGSLGKPINLGPKVNTKGRESFPFITIDNELYFSSDGHFGLGGYDVFYFDLKTTGKQLLNVGAPVNSATDDFAFSINNSSQKGFFSSNRAQADNIYALTETAPIKELLEALFKGVVVDKETGKPLPNASITVTSEDKNTSYSVVTDNNGKFLTTLNRFKSHTVTVTNKDYDVIDTFLVKGKEAYNEDFKLVRNVFEIRENSDLSKILHLNHIYFDLNKASIKKDAEIELEKIVVAMKQYPSLKIDVRAHTDNRADANTNMVLSNKRAKATINYLISKGISKTRITGRGYGETQLINACVVCTKEQHQLNRRSEFIIIND